MIRIHRVYSTCLPSDADRLDQVKAIFRSSFPDVAEYADKIADHLDNPFRYGYHAVLLVSESGLGQVSGFALLFLLPEINTGQLAMLLQGRYLKRIDSYPKVDGRPFSRDQILARIEQLLEA